MESLNDIIYRMHPELFPDLIKWENMSVSYRNYYSTATSTFMTLQDLAYGDMYQFEICDRLNMPLYKYNKSGSFLNNLKNKGYIINVLDCSNNDSEGNRNGFIGKEIEMDCVSVAEKDLMQEKINSFFESVDISSAPFVLWLIDTCNNISNTKIWKGNSCVEKWKNSYKHINETASLLFQVIKKRDMLNDVCVIFYGDHGDDLYVHGTHKGFSHGIEPYFTLIKTPMWIYNGGQKRGVIDCLIDTTDICKLVEKILYSSESAVDDLYQTHRKYSFSRNWFAAQVIRRGTFNKAYTVTDGEILFKAGNNGMSMFSYSLDPTSNHNLLDYYDIVDDTLVWNCDAYQELNGHFSRFFSENDKNNIIIKYKELKKVLIDKVNSFYEYSDRPEWVNEIDFSKIDYSEEALDYRNNKNKESEFSIYYVRNKRVVIYGAGKCGKEWFDTINGNTEIVAWVDKNYKELEIINNVKILPIRTIYDVEFDYVIIAIEDNKTHETIKKMLMENGIERNRII